MTPMPMPIPLSPEASDRSSRPSTNAASNSAPRPSSRASIPQRSRRSLRDGARGPLRPVPRRAGAPRAGGGRGVGAHRRRLDPGRPRARSRRSSRTCTRSATSRARRSAGRRDRGRRGRDGRRRAHPPLRGGDEPPPYQGVASCYIEFGGAEVAKFDVNFLGGPTRRSASRTVVALAAAKKDFGATRRQRWFGRA